MSYLKPQRTYPCLTKHQWLLLDRVQRNHGVLVVSETPTRLEPQRRTIMRLMQVGVLGLGVWDEELRVTIYRLTDKAVRCLKRHAEEVENKRLQKEWLRI